jgi:hypothetical protein
MNSVEKIFPEYFCRFVMPEGAHEESILVYRACRTGKCDRESFLSSYEQNGFNISFGGDPTDPSEYSMSVFEKPNHIKRMANLVSDFKIPYVIAKGYTNPTYGLVQRTSERKSKQRSHIDWWLYKDATPWIGFEIIPDFDEYLQSYKGNSER